MDDFRGAIREDVQKGKSAINEGLLYLGNFSNEVLHPPMRVLLCRFLPPFVRYLYPNHAQIEGLSAKRALSSIPGFLWAP